MTDVAVVLRVVDLLEAARLRVWLFGGWAEELRGLRAPCEHHDVDFLYPGRDLARVDRFIGDGVLDPQRMRPRLPLRFPRRNRQSSSRDSTGCDTHRRERVRYSRYDQVQVCSCYRE